MYLGKLVFPQLMDFLPMHQFRRCVDRYKGNHHVKAFFCLDQFPCMAFAQLSYRESLRDIESCLTLQRKLNYTSQSLFTVGEAGPIIFLLPKHDTNGWRCHGIRCIVPNLKMVRTALTIKCLVGDASAVVKAIDNALPGNVLVIDAGGTNFTTLFGSMSATAAKLRGIAGCVTNGAVRDYDELVEISLPVFAAGVSIRGNVKNHQGWIGIDVTVGGVIVQSGDIVVGDSDGVVVVPAKSAEQICSKASKQQEKERQIMQRILSRERLTKFLALRNKRPITT